MGRYKILADTTMPLISVIVPVYNGAPYIEDCLNRLLQSSYSHLELLVGDDASTDLTRTKLKPFENNPKVRLFYFPKRLGAGGVRNHLLAEAHGEFIALQDADDRSHPERFLRQLDRLQKQPHLDAVATAAKLVDPTGFEWGEIKVKPALTRFDWYTQRGLVHASLMFRRAILTDSTYHEKLTAGEDFYFLTGLYLKNRVIENITEPLYYYTLEVGELRQRSRRHFFSILKAKWAISRLFPFPENVFFFILNCAVLLTSVSRGILLIPQLLAIKIKKIFR